MVGAGESLEPNLAGASCRGRIGFKFETTRSVGAEGRKSPRSWGCGSNAAGSSPGDSAAGPDRTIGEENVATGAWCDSHRRAGAVTNQDVVGWQGRRSGTALGDG